MKTFSISESALLEIQRIFRQWNCADPVADLYEHSYVRGTFDDLNARFFEGNSSLEEMRTTVTERFARVEPSLKSSMVINVKERAEYQPNALCQIGDVTFIMGHGFAEALWEYCLAFEEGEFFFKGPDNVRHTFRSLGKIVKFPGSA